MMSPALRDAPVRKPCAAGSAASSSARARVSVAAPGNRRRPKIPEARAISAFHRASRRAAPSAQVTISRSTGVAPLGEGAWRVANSNMRAGDAPAEGEPALVTSPQMSVLSRRSSAEMWPSSRAWKTHWRANARRLRANTASVTSKRVAAAASRAPKMRPWRW